MLNLNNKKNTHSLTYDRWKTRKKLFTNVIYWLNQTNHIKKKKKKNEII